MTMMPFEARVRSVDGMAQIDLAGRIDATAEENLYKAYQQAEALGSMAIRLDFHQVGYINSTGIALIVGLLARAKKNRQVLEVYGLSEHYREIFRVTRLSDYMTIADDASR